MARILLVDDEQGFTEATTGLLELGGHEVRTADTLARARAALEAGEPDLLLLDLMLPDGNGLELLEALDPDSSTVVAVITGHPAVKSAIRDLAGPTVTYLTKPIDREDLDRLLARLGSPPEPDTDETDTRHFGLMIGESAPMQKLYRELGRVAPTHSTVFLFGESGTGKELAALAIHRESGCGGAFVAVNCGAINSELANSELFGHEKGSFTGASRQHVGYFEQAAGGTLFLDEITEMAPALQVNLLRALETGRIARVGGEREIPVDARVVAATNRDPAEAVQEGSLREDLYFRLSVFPLRIPPLRERRGDVPLLARAVLDRLNREHGTELDLDDADLERLAAYHWPGNVRELQHTLHRAYIMTPAEAGTLELPERFEFALRGTARDPLRPGRSIGDVERELILRTLEHFDGNKRAAAETLGISLKTLYNRLNAYKAADGESAGTPPVGT